MGKPVPKNPHGSKVRVYRIWSGMKGRCSPTARSTFKDYGGRGIRVCAEWQQYDPFYEWAMANGYRDDLSIDRIDNDKGYSPDNCRWATAKQQARNTRRNVIMQDGERSVCLAEAAEDHAVNYGSLYGLHRKGMADELAVDRLVHHKAYKIDAETPELVLARQILAECVTPGSRTHQALVDNKLFGSTAAVSAKQALHAMRRFAEAVLAKEIAA